MFSVSQCHPLSRSGYHGNEDEAEAEDCFCAVFYGVPYGSRLCTDAAR